MKKIYKPGFKKEDGETITQWLEILEPKKEPKEPKEKRKTIKCINCKIAVLTKHRLECWCSKTKGFKNPYRLKTCQSFTPSKFSKRKGGERK